MELLRMIHEVVVTKDQLAAIIFENKRVNTVNKKKEPVSFQGPGTCVFGFDTNTDREMLTIFLTYTYKNITYRGTLILSSDDGEEYNGVFFYDLKDIVVRE